MGVGPLRSHHAVAELAARLGFTDGEVRGALAAAAPPGCPDFIGEVGRASVVKLFRWTEAPLRLLDRGPPLVMLVGFRPERGALVQAAIEAEVECRCDRVGSAFAAGYHWGLARHSAWVVDRSVGHACQEDVARRIRGDWLYRDTRLVGLHGRGLPLGYDELIPADSKPGQVADAVARQLLALRGQLLGLGPTKWCRPPKKRWKHSPG